MLGLAIVDWCLTAIHVAVVLGFVTLWIPRRTARLHRALVILTAFSWLVLGATKGFGYCFLTDFQWRVKHARGITHLPGSFLKYAGDFVTGQNLPPRQVDTVAACAFVLVCVATIVRYRQEVRDTSASVKPPS
jgi:hypothetical protein